jgi:hypothetical protein
MRHRSSALLTAAAIFSAFAATGCAEGPNNNGNRSDASVAVGTTVGSGSAPNSRAVGTAHSDAAKDPMGHETGRNTTSPMQPNAPVGAPKPGAGQVGTGGPGHGDLGSGPNGTGPAAAGGGAGGGR